MGRGPSYPYVNLEDAIALARKMYAYAKRGAAAADSVISEAWEYSTTSSSGQKVLAALKAFSLIEDVQAVNSKPAIKLTQRAIHILLEDQDTPERREEIKKAALSPKWYEYCWKMWGKDMPPAMKSNLLIEHGFVDTTVDGFLKDYRKTMAFAGLLDDVIFSDSSPDEDESKPVPKVGDYVQWESQGVLRMSEAKKLVRFEAGFAFVEGSPTGIPIGEVIPAEAPESKPFVPQNIFIPAVTVPVVKGETKMQNETFALPEGVTGQLQWPTAMSADAFADFVYQLEGLKMRVRRAVRDPKDIEVKSGDENAS
jgi:hypothetical protein